MAKIKELTLDEMLSLAKLVPEWRFEKKRGKWVGDKRIDETSTLESVTDIDDNLRYIDIHIGYDKQGGKKLFWINCRCGAYINRYNINGPNLGNYREKKSKEQPSLSELYNQLSETHQDTKGKHWRDQDRHYNPEVENLIKNTELIRLRKLVR